MTNEIVKRLRYLSHHRSMKEADKLIGDFCDDCLDSLEGDALMQFQALLEENDPDIFDWIYDREALPDRHDNAVYARMKKFVKERAGI
ncbi:MAG: succinate dehydrogenase assembly factor 2 [Alphaproteobacteria bacterium]